MASELIVRALPDEPGLDLGLSHALLRQVASGEREPLVRLYRPGPTAAFGRRDRLRPGFPAACAVARKLGFVPLLRAAGGLAAVYDERSLIVERFSVEREHEIGNGIPERFAAIAEVVTAVLRDLDVDARVGEIAGEYCPGEHSVNVGGRIKVAGAAQRLVRGGAMVSLVLVVDGGPRVREAVERIYAALGLPLDPSVTGALTDVAPGLEIGRVETALRHALAPEATVVEPDPPLLAAARELADWHLVDEH